MPVEWDEGNLDHATRHGVSAEEIEQAISNAVEFRRNKHRSWSSPHRGGTDEGRDPVVIIQLFGSAGSRPITAWEAA